MISSISKQCFTMFSRVIFFVTCLYLSAVLIKDVQCGKSSEDYSKILEEFLDEYFLDDDDLPPFDFSDLDLLALDPIVFENETYDLSELEVTGLRGVITLHQFKMKGFSDFIVKDAYESEDLVDGHELISYKAMFPLISYNIYFSADVEFFGIQFCKIMQFKMDLENYDINLNSLTTINAATVLYHIKQNVKISMQSENC